MSDFRDRAPAGVPTGGQYVASARAEAGNVELGTAPAKPYVLLDEPEMTVRRGLRITNHVAEPITVEEGIHSYGGICWPEPARYAVPAFPSRAHALASGAYGHVPPRAYRFSGGPAARDGMNLMRVEGHARSHAEGWDRLGQAEGEWARRFDRRPSHARYIENPETWSAPSDAAAEARIAAADRLNEAVERRLEQPRFALSPKARRVRRRAEAEVADAWAEYCTQYPDAERDAEKSKEANRR